MALEVFTGPRCRFSLNGVPVALGRNVAASEEIVYDPLEVLNNIEVVEHVPVGYRCSMTASQILQVDKTLELLNLWPNKGLTPQTHLRNILTLPKLVAQIEDEITPGIVAQVIDVKCASRNFSVDARGMVPQELSFVARRILSAGEAA